MDLFVDPTRPRALSRSLYDQIRAAIGSGRLLPGERLPSSRRLADDLGVARQTIATVYGRLAAEGHVVGRGAAGTFVADEIDVETAGAEGRRSPRGRGAPPTVLEPRVGLPAPLVASETPRFDLRSGSPDLALFPHVPWRRAALAAAHRAPTGYGDHAGLPELRRALARRLARTRGVIADPEQIVVTTGAQAAIDLTIRIKEHDVLTPLEQAAEFEALLLANETMCYRDERGRKYFVTFDGESLADTRVMREDATFGLIEEAYDEGYHVLDTDFEVLE